MRLIDLSTPYLTRQLIAYIGNKRALLGFLSEVFFELEQISPIGTFLDPFAGSGSVARLARLLGYRVFANDWEPYSHIVNSCHITINRSELADMFRPRGGIRTVFDELNAARYAKPGFVTSYYAPASTAAADYRKERMFYTRENALFIDGVRNQIERWYPGDSLEPSQLKEKNILLSSLIYEAATHANTSGVFKAYHKGFGGHGKDALSRIMHPMQLEVPELINSVMECEGCRMDAERFSRQRPVDLCYLDPPYNSHQYGSNYHLLNTVALWDNPAVDNSINPGGTLKAKAGIRSDWIKTKSRFCYKDTAPGAFANLLDAIDARFIVLSYNTEGIIPFEELYELMGSTGALSLRTMDYIKYRGGKQSIDRKVHNEEFVMVLDRSANKGNSRQLSPERFLLERRINALTRGAFHPERIRETFRTGGIQTGAEYLCLLKLIDGNPSLTLTIEDCYRFSDCPSTQELRSHSDLSLSEFARKLEYCAVRDRLEEASVLVEILMITAESRRRSRYLNKLVNVIKKFAFRKYKNEFENTLTIIQNKMKQYPAVFRGLGPKLKEIERIASLRFNG